MLKSDRLRSNAMNLHPNNQWPAIVETIGKTPLVRLNRLFRNGPQVFGKLESFNPFGSIKDRSAYAMLKQGLEDGKVLETTTIVESTSGNMGIALANLCKLIGLNLICVIDPHAKLQTRRFLQSLGVKIEVADEFDPKTSSFLPARLMRAEKLGSRPNHYWLNQYRNPAVITGLFPLLDELFIVHKQIDYLLCATSTCGMRSISPSAEFVCR